MDNKTLTIDIYEAIELWYKDEVIEYNKDLLRDDGIETLMNLSLLQYEP